MALALPKTLTAGTPENVNDLNSNLNYLLALQSDRGNTNIGTTETRSNTAYGTLTTPDQVSVTLAANGLIAVAYQATWQESVSGAARAAIFLGAAQTVIANTTGAPGASAIEATLGGTAAHDVPLTTYYAGLISSTASVGSTADLTTGQVVGLQPAATGPIGGPCFIFAAAGTYAVSVQFKASSGSVTAKNRKLWVWTLGF